MGRDGYADALAAPHVWPLDLGGRLPKGYVVIDEVGLLTDQQLQRWVQGALAVVDSLPAR